MDAVTVNKGPGKIGVDWWGRAAAIAENNDSVLKSNLLIIMCFFNRTWLFKPSYPQGLTAGFSDLPSFLDPTVRP